jgi:hypothetical protein
LRKALGNRQDTVLALTDLLHIVSIPDVRSSDIEKALISEIDDVEDAFIDSSTIISVIFLIPPIA